MRGLGQDAISRHVAVGVVDRLETVEIDDADGKGAALCFRPLVLFRQLGEKPAAIGQTGQAVEIGDAEVLVAQPSGFCLRGGQLFEITRIGQQDENHGHGNQGEVDRNGAQGGVAFEEKEQDEGGIGRQGHAQCRRSQVHQAENTTNDRQGHAEDDLAFGIRIAVWKKHQPPDREGKGQDSGQLCGDPCMLYHMRIVEN